MMVGTASLSNSKRFPASSASRRICPVMLPLGCQHSCAGVGDDDVRLELDQLGSERRQAVPGPRGETVGQADGLPLHIAQLLQALPEGREATPS